MRSRLVLGLRGARRVRGRYVVRRGEAFRVVGILRPFVGGQSFTVSFRRGRRVRRVEVRSRRFGSSRKGGFVVRHRRRTSGPIVIRARHRATGALAGVSSRRVRVLVR